MTASPATTPVILFVYRRPDLLTHTFERIRAARPTQLLIIADVPDDENGGATDPQHRAALAIAGGVDWDCDVEWHIAEQHLGCSTRMRSGLDWAFTRVERAIIIEDDIVADPSFFPWCTAMLEMYSGDQRVMSVNGRNELVAWPAAGGDHLLARRGSIWGWATWRRAWQHRRARKDAPTSTGNPLFDAHLGVLGLEVPDGLRLGWDIDWTLDIARTAGVSVVPPVNLVANIGFGGSATHTMAGDDLRGVLPVGSVPVHSSSARVEELDDVYDHWSLLVELMATYRQPAAAARLARLSGRPGVPAIDDSLRHHLAPFADPDESLRVLSHLRNHGAAGAQLAALTAAMEQASRWNSERPA